MQGKGIVKFFLVVMALVTLLQYIFILPTRKVEKAAEAYATKASATIQDPVQQKAVMKQAKAAFLDSMSTETIFSIPLLKSYTYQELKAQQLALGLDLKGGMSIVLQVDLKEFIRAMAQNAKDPTFVEALDKASQAQEQTQQDFVTLFADAWRASANGQRLAPIFQRNPSLRDEINYNSSDGEVIRVLRAKSDETVNQTFELLKQRIDKLGVVQPNVSLDAERDLITVELPGIDNPERARSYLQAAANLEFFETYRISDAGVLQAFNEADMKLAALNGAVEKSLIRVDTIFAKDSLGNEDRSNIVSLDSVYQEAGGPLLGVNGLAINAQGLMGPAVMGTANRNQMAAISAMLENPEVAPLFPSDLAFRWSRNPVMDRSNSEAGTLTDQYELYAIKAGRDGEAALTGEFVTTASAQPDPTTNQIAVSLQMDNEGAKIWSRMTTAAAQGGNREIAILLDDLVVSAPRVNEPITGGSSQITGGFDIQEATDLANILQIGRLPVRTEIIQESLVGPSLGQENIDRSMTALIIGFLIVMVFMVLYYSSAGFFSVLALLLNLVFIFAALASYGTVLTLPGIAGIVLTIGMAVDANVIIFERVREEIRDGKSLIMSIADGFKNSYSAIIDANVTTILTAMVLAYFGLGPIKGFAVVLIIGVLSSLFTAVLVSRVAIEWWTGRGKTIKLGNATTMNGLTGISFDWLGSRKKAYVLSGVLITAGIVSMVVRGFDLGVDFKGGYSYNVTFDSSVKISADKLRNSLKETFGGQTPVVKSVDTENTFNIVTSYLISAQEEGGVLPEDRVMEALYNGVKGLSEQNLSIEAFKATDSDGTHVTSFSKVGPTIADDIMRSALFAGLFALLMIFLYLFLRFSRWEYSLGAVGALFHDTLVTLSIFSLGHGFLPFSMEIDQAFIAAILTVIGYSINDTVVVFDRIREFLHNYSKSEPKQVINNSINTTLSRTLLTSLTTLFVVFVLFFFGGASIKGFAFALLVGITVGTYSSVFVAAPLMYDFSKKRGFSAKKDTTAAGDELRKPFSKAAHKA